jgi:methylglyoxal synthase
LAAVGASVIVSDIADVVSFLAPMLRADHRPDVE